jgi:hypothetical protein
MRPAIQILLLSAVVFLAAFAVERIFLPGVTAVSWNQEPQSAWALEAAFMLRAIENIAALVMAILVILVTAGWIGRRWGWK